MCNVAGEVKSRTAVKLTEPTTAFITRTHAQRSVYVHAQVHVHTGHVISVDIYMQICIGAARI